jgi:hypothetical protein
VFILTKEEAKQRKTALVMRSDGPSTKLNAAALIIYGPVLGCTVLAYLYIYVIPLVFCRTRSHAMQPGKKRRKPITGLWLR